MSNSTGFSGVETMKEELEKAMKYLFLASLPSPLYTLFLLIFMLAVEEWGLCDSDGGIGMFSGMFFACA